MYRHEEVEIDGKSYDLVRRFNGREWEIVTITLNEFD